MKKIYLVSAVAMLILAACGTMNPINTNGSTEISCPKEIGGDLCTSEKGHFDVTDACEYQTDTPYSILIKYSTIHKNVSLLGQLTPNKEYTISYEGGSVDHFTCVLDFSANEEYKTVNFEIIKQK